MPHRVTIRRTFCAAHHLRFEDGTVEPVHGHNWHVSLTVRRVDGKLDAIGCVMDFHDLESRLDTVIGHWNNNDLNAHAPFCNGVNPTAESVAETIALAILLPEAVEVERVDITEAEGCVATFLPS